MHDVECWITAACEEVLQKVEEMSGNFRAAGQWSLSLRETWWDGVKRGYMERESQRELVDC